MLKYIHQLGTTGVFTLIRNIDTFMLHATITFFVGLGPIIIKCHYDMISSSILLALTHTQTNGPNKKRLQTKFPDEVQKIPVNVVRPGGTIFY